jgi:hypothetical protein
MPRREFTTKTKRIAYERCHINGVPCCEKCKAPLQIGRFTYDHIDPDYFSKDNSLENCQVIGWCCDKPKTAKDQKDIAKVKRIRDRFTGIKKPKVGFRGSRKFNGEVTWRK